jgi:hypothetical protein
VVKSDTISKQQTGRRGEMARALLRKEFIRTAEIDLICHNGKDKARVQIYYRDPSAGGRGHILRTDYKKVPLPSNTSVTIKDSCQKILELLGCRTDGVRLEEIGEIYIKLWPGEIIYLYLLKRNDEMCSRKGPLTNGTLRPSEELLSIMANLYNNRL